MIFSGLNLFSQSFKQNIDARVINENQHTAVFFIEGIKDSISINNFESESEIVSEEDIFPIKKQDLKDKISWDFSWGISSYKTIVHIHFNPFFINTSGEISRVKSISIDISSTNPKEKSLGNYKTANQSLLAQGKWYKYAVIKEGIYKIDYTSMQNSGITVSDISSVNEIKIFSFGSEMLPYGNAVKHKDDLPEIAIKRVDNGNGFFDEGDYILFYAKAGFQWKYDDIDEMYKHQLNIYSDTTFYYLNFNSNSSKEISAQILSNTKTVDVYSFLDRQFHEAEERNLLRSGNLWLGDHFGETSTKEFTINFPNVDKNENVKLYSRLYAKNKSIAGSTFDIEVNNGGKQSIFIAGISGNSTDDIAKNASNLYSILPSDDHIDVKFTYNAPYSFSEGWIDFFDVNAYRKLIYTDSPLTFSNPKLTGAGTVIDFHITQCSNNLSLWEITDFENVKNINYTLSNDSISFTVNADTLREFVLFNPSQALNPMYYEQVKNQNLHGLISKKLLIITHPALLAEAQRLANFHEQQDSLSANVVLINEVYNEFSGGIKDICGIRNFIKMLYQKTYVGSDTLQYVLFLGDGTFDYKNIMPGNRNLIPTFQSANSTKETASYTSDDFFALLDDHEGAWTISSSELPDVAIGRIPVSSAKDAKVVVDKIFSYSNYFDGQNTNMVSEKENLFTNWKNEIMFIADDEDFNIHMKQADQLAVKIDNNFPNFNVDKVYLDSYKQEGNSSQPLYPEAKKSIFDKINKGVFLVNYTGHGGEDGLSAERVIETQDLRALKNGIKMPLFFTATCDFSRFDMIDATSAGEALLLNENGGAIALFSTTRIVYSSPNFNLNNNFYNIIFAKKEGDNTHIGDVFKETKVINNGGLNDRNFTLLG
ncbi:MAG: type IX secretion system sortase PorU, partial [Flavobacteriales bacterium]